MEFRLNKFVSELKKSFEGNMRKRFFKVKLLLA